MTLAGARSCNRQRAAAPAAVAAGGLIRDGVSSLAEAGTLGAGLASPATGYVAVYTIEIALLFATLIAVGPLVRVGGAVLPDAAPRYGLADFTR